MRASEITPVAQKIDRLIKRVEDGDIKIPAFQRGFVWKQDQVMELLDSILADYPIGSILLWNSSEILEATRNIAGFPLPDRDPTYPVNYVLDGQQRLSSIYAVFSGHTYQDNKTAEYNPDTKIFNIYYDCVNQIFMTEEDASGPNMDKACIICLRNFLYTTVFLDQLQTLNKDYHQLAKDLYSKFVNYEVPVVTIRNRNKEEVGIIFERINNTGTKLNMLDLMVAWTWSADFHLKKAIADLLTNLDEKGFGDIPSKIVLQSISGIIQNTTKTKEILKLDPHMVRERFEELTSAFQKAVDFLFTEFNCANVELLPHVQQLVGLSKFFNLLSSPSSAQIDCVKQWFWNTSFSRRYSGQTDDKMNIDIKLMTEIADNNFSRVGSYSYEVDVKTLQDTTFSKGHPYVRAFLLLMSDNTPLDLVKGTKVDTGSALSQFNRKEYHHVFPKAFLTDKGVPSDKINSLANFCLLPSDSNKKVSKKKPSNYFFEIIPNDKYSIILKSNILPLNKDIYRNDDYDKFLDERSMLLIQKLDEIINS